MRDQNQPKQPRQPVQQQQNRPASERKRRFDTLVGSADEPQICRGID